MRTSLSSQQPFACRKEGTTYLIQDLDASREEVNHFVQETLVHLELHFLDEAFQTPKQRA